MAFKKGHEVMNITHGADHLLVRELERQISEAQLEEKVKRDGAVPY